MKPPTGIELIEGELASYYLDDENILHSYSKSPTRTIENVRKNIELVGQITHHQKVCTIVYLTRSGKPDKATRDFVAEQLPNMYKAMAIVSKSGLGKFVMNFIFSRKPPSIPMKTFSNEDTALAWLRQYL